MYPPTSTLIRTAELALAAQQRELDHQLAAAAHAVFVRRATGSSHIAAAFGLDRKFRLIYVRCHFTGSTMLAAFTLSLDSATASVFNAALFSVTQAGPTRDVHLRLDRNETAEPSPWTFQTGDTLRIDWTNPSPGNITWGLEVGMALAT